MMTNETLNLLLSMIAGLLLGSIFFGGLWLTIRKGISSKHPALWFLASFIFRTGVVLAGFYFASAHEWKRFLICLLGFIIARVLMRFLVTSLSTLEQEAPHAPHS